MISLDDVQILCNQGAEAVHAHIITIVQGFESRLKDLEGRLHKDSNNSSKPPSSDGYAKKPNPQSLRGKSGKEPGAQFGHKGSSMKPAEKVDFTIPLSPTHCKHCATSLEGVPTLEIEKRQVHDIPDPKPLITQFESHTKCCPNCHGLNCGTFPEHVKANVQYGPNIKAATVFLSVYHFIPYSRTCESVGELLGLTLSKGSIRNWLKDASYRLIDIEKYIKNALVKSKTLHFDETGLRVNNKLKWLHLSCNRWLTYYHIHAKRGKEALDAIGILANYEHTAIHDGWSMYSMYDCLHGLCNAHHLRELKYSEEEYSQPWAKKMAELLCEIKAAVEVAVARNLLFMEPAQKESFKAKYQAVLDEGYAANPEPPPNKKTGKTRQGKVRCLLLRLDKKRDQALAFMHDFEVPFDNNQAERDIRMMKVKQKVSGCFRSEAAAADFCRIRSYTSTMRKQGHKILPLMQSLFKGKPVMPNLTL